MAADEHETGAETLSEVASRLARETTEAYGGSPFAALSRDYFSRFWRDESVRADKDDVELDDNWEIALSGSTSELTRLMAEALSEFLEQAMGLSVPVREVGNLGRQASRRIALQDWDGGVPDGAGSFTLAVAREEIRVSGRDPEGLRDGVVRLVDAMGMRRAPILARGHQVFRPRLGVRLGSVPYQGSYRDLVFLGYNAVFAGGGDLHALSRSGAIPALVERQQSTLPPPPVEARQYGLKTYAFVNTRQKFPADDPVFTDHPDIRGARTWSADGEFTLCTEHPLVKDYLRESVRGIFEHDPDLDGLVLIIGGEGFYHCYMRPHGVGKGRTNCDRCDPLSAERVVANLLNLLAEAVQSVNPRAEVIAWPYSAEHVWSRDRAQTHLIEQLDQGVGIFTEIEKDEYVEKADGVRKHLWDYSIDLIGPGERARQQVEACRERGLSVYMKSEPELGFEAARLPHIPCMDRWAARAEALAACGADGAWVFPAFRPLYGTSAAEVNKHFWWDPVPDVDVVLEQLAGRLAGADAGPHLRRAWREVSAAIEWSPELPPYYSGPTYLGPAHPMCADPETDMPEVFDGLYLFRAEAQDAEGLKAHPTYFREPRGDVEVFERFYRKMESCLRRAVEQVAMAEPGVPEGCRLTFEAEALPIRWLHHTIRTTANFYESCRLRDRLQASPTGESVDEEGRSAWERWREVLLDEQDNARDAVPVADADVRLDFYYGSDHTFPHLADMLAAKLVLLESEIDEYLPAVAERLGIR
ncbi:hypothetical protein ACFL6X_04070 [Candidatus Latescibacterota bacterium]